MTHASVAAKHRKNKELHPERYCSEPRCLYRTKNWRCPTHTTLCQSLGCLNRSLTGQTFCLSHLPSRTKRG
jgi:hypothetical protein